MYLLESSKYFVFSEIKLFYLPVSKIVLNAPLAMHANLMENSQHVFVKMD